MYLLGLQASQPKESGSCSLGGWVHRDKAPDRLADVLHLSLKLHGCLSTRTVVNFLQKIAAEKKPEFSGDAMLAKAVISHSRRDIETAGLTPADWDCVSQAVVDAVLGMYDFMMLTEDLTSSYRTMLRLLHRNPGWYKEEYVVNKKENVRLHAPDAPTPPATSPSRRELQWMEKPIKYVEGVVEVAKGTATTAAEAVATASVLRLPEVLEASALDHEVWRRATIRYHNLQNL